MEVILVLILGYILISVLLPVFIVCIGIANKKMIDKQIDGLANNTLEMTPEEFMTMRKMSFGGKGRKSYALTKNFEGVYILYNKTKNIYYVGQGKQVLNRVNAHFTGKGNGDVYADYKYGDEFTIKMIELERSGFTTLNELESELSSDATTSEQKNNLYEQIKTINTNKGLEETLEKKIKNTYNCETFTKIENNSVKVVVDKCENSKSLANNIMRSIQEEFDNKMYISVQFET